MNINPARCRITANAGLAPISEGAGRNGRVSAPIYLPTASLLERNGFIRRYSYNVSMHELEDGRVRSALRDLRSANKRGAASEPPTSSEYTPLSSATIHGRVHGGGEGRLVKSGSLNSLDLVGRKKKEEEKIRNKLSPLISFPQASLLFPFLHPAHWTRNP